MPINAERALQRILIVGAGGHGKVLIDALQTDRPLIELILADESDSKQGRMLIGQEVVRLEDAISRVTDFHVSIGGNAARKRMALQLLSHGMKYFSVRHPQACVSRSALVADGVFLAAYSVVAPDSCVGRGSIVNHGAVVDHDCIVGEFTHIAPNATLGGGVAVGNEVLIGAGANILPGVRIGDECTVGAGSVVLCDLESGCSYAGVPAHILNK